MLYICRLPQTGMTSLRRVPVDLPQYREPWRSPEALSGLSRRSRLGWMVIQCLHLSPLRFGVSPNAKLRSATQAAPGRRPSSWPPHALRASGNCRADLTPRPNRRTQPLTCIPPILLPKCRWKMRRSIAEWEKWPAGWEKSHVLRVCFSTTR
jgi:hypothetical protein